MNNESTESFTQSLDIVLTRLAKPTWAEPLAALEKNFRYIPKEDISFGAELLQLLWSLEDPNNEDAALPILSIFAVRFSRLDAWTYRFTKKTPTGHEYINPLIARETEFEGCLVSQSGTAFPAEDIIKRWARDHLV